MLDELLGTWLDKKKAQRELCKAYKFYGKKKIPYLCAKTIETYEELQDIQYAIAYILCEYFDFNYQYYDGFPFSYKWCIAYDYITHYDSCKSAYIKFVKANESILIRGCDIMYANGTSEVQKVINKIYNGRSNAHIIYDIENDYMYWKDKHENIWKRC